MQNPFGGKKQKRYPNPRGRIDLGVGPDETGAYAAPQPDGKPCVVYRLRCLTDGMVVDFVDDGEGREGVALNGRSNLLNAITKRRTSFVGDDEVDFPVFFADKRIGNGFDRIGRFNVPVADKAVRDECKRLSDTRNRRRKMTHEEWEMQKQAEIASRVEAEEKAKKAMGKDV